MSQLFSFIKNILGKHIHSDDVFDNIMDELFSSTLSVSFSCKEHDADVLSKSVYYYVLMRIKQYYKQYERKNIKSSAKKKKESRLQSS